MSCNNVYAKKPIKKTSVKTHYALPINKPYSENKALNSRFLQASFASFQNTGDPGKNHGVNAIAYNPDGSTLAFVDNDGMLKLWNMAAASIEATAAAENYDGGGVGCVVLQSNDDCDISKRHKNLWPIYSLAYSADGKTIATSSGGANGVKTWNAKTLLAIYTFSHQGAPVKTLAYSPSGKIIATGMFSEDAAFQPSTYQHNTIMLRDTIAGGDLLTIQTGEGAVQALAFSPDGESLASATSDQNIALWDAKTGNRIRYFDIHNYVKDQEYANAVAFSPNGLTLATGGMNKEPYYGVLRFWNVSDAANIKMVKEGQQINAVVFSHDGKKLATANFDGKLRVYEVASGKKLAEFIGHKGNVTSVAFSPDDKTLASGSADTTIKFWKAN
jgi:WD40 repeat protein